MIPLSAFRLIQRHIFLVAFIFWRTLYLTLLTCRVFAKSERRLRLEAYRLITEIVMVLKMYLVLKKDLIIYLIIYLITAVSKTNKYLKINRGDVPMKISDVPMKISDVPMKITEKKISTKICTVYKGDN